MAQVVNKNFPLSQYKWGDNCDGWVLVDSESLSVKQERMPAGTEEALHCHEKSQQFFFILQGIATVEIEGNLFQVNQLEGIHIKAGQKHRIINRTNQDLEFVLSSEPSTINDRFNISEVKIK